jgi:hypothetical protein
MVLLIWQESLPGGLRSFNDLLDMRVTIKGLDKS